MIAYRFSDCNDVSWSKKLFVNPSQRSIKKIWMDSHSTKIRGFSIFHLNISKYVTRMAWASRIREKPTTNETLSMKASTLYYSFQSSYYIVKNLHPTYPWIDELLHSNLTTFKEKVEIFYLFLYRVSYCFCIYVFLWLYS